MKDGSVPEPGDGWPHDVVVRMQSESSELGAVTDTLSGEGALDEQQVAGVLGSVTAGSNDDVGLNIASSEESSSGSSIGKSSSLKSSNVSPSSLPQQGIEGSEPRRAPDVPKGVCTRKMSMFVHRVTFRGYRSAKDYRDCALRRASENFRLASAKRCRAALEDYCRAMTRRAYENFV